MTALLERSSSAWRTRPGWGISVDLMPHEVITARQTRVHRRLIGLGLVLVLLLCVGVSLLARSDRAAAEREYEREQSRTAVLAAAADDYAGITTMQTVTARTNTDLATLMADDVDMVNLIARIRQAAPAGVTIDDLSVVLTPPDPVDPAAAPDDQGATGQLTIGAVSLSGTAGVLDDVAPFVSALNRLRGTRNVLPSLTTQSDTGADYTISLDVTDRLYTGRFEQEATQ